MAVTVVAVAAAFWWAYFDVLAIVAERRLTELTGTARNEMARDSYSYLHFPLVAGIVLVALAAKETVLAPTHVLEAVPAAALGGGAALYFITLSMLRWRNIGRVNVQRLVGAVVAAGIAVPLAGTVSGLAGLVGVALVYRIVITYETITRANVRHDVRHADDHA